MKKLLFSILSALLLMVSTMASAQTYVNVELKDGTIRSYSTESTSKVSFGAKKEIGTINGHAFIELAGYKWATENVGSVENWLRAVGFDPTYGLYYAQKVDDVEYAKLAAESWGGTWTLPTHEQWQALIDSCYWVWANDYNGQNGIIVYEAQTDDDKGKYIGNSTPSEVYTSTNVPHIFLPAAGIYDLGDRNVLDQGDWGCYWSANDVCYLDFGNSSREMLFDNKYDGMSVRPVSE